MRAKHAVINMLLDADLMEIGEAWSKHPEAIDWLKSLK